MVWDLVGHDFSRWGCRVGFCAVAWVTALHVVCYVMAHSWPREVVSDQFGCFPQARVAHDWVVMVGFHYVELQLTITGDIDLSSIEY